MNVPLNGPTKQTSSSAGSQIDPTLRLRPRLMKNETKKTREKKSCKALVARRVPIIRPEPCKEVEINQIVLFKMRGHCEWPAYVLSKEGNIVEVEFFGDHTTQRSALGENILQFENSSELILFNLRNRKKADYQKAIKEVEIVMRVSPENSILNRI